MYMFQVRLNARTVGLAARSRKYPRVGFAKTSKDRKQGGENNGYLLSYADAVAPKAAQGLCACRELHGRLWVAGGVTKALQHWLLQEGMWIMKADVLWVCSRHVMVDGRLVAAQAALYTPSTASHSIMPKCAMQNTHSADIVLLPGIEPGPVAWETTILPLD